jgi:predicted RNase H-like HicB family nuclease
MLEYHAAYYPLAGGWYMAKVVDFPGTISQGKDLENARWMIRDALKLMAECTIERGKSLPRPNPRARDKKAELVEPVLLTVRVQSAGQDEKKKTATAPSRA